MYKDATKKRYHYILIDSFNPETLFFEGLNGKIKY